MKNLKNLSICLMFALFGVLTTNAQTAVMSGSFQFTNDINRRVGVLVLQSNMQKFEFPISENIVIANLLPGRYSLIIEFQSGGRGGGMTKLSQNIDIESERRTICRMNASAVLGFAKEYDRSSTPIFAGNFRDDRRDFDRRDNDRVVVQPPVPQPVPDFEFNKLYNAVQNEKFSDSKMRTLKTSSNFYEYFSSEQVKRLALLFEFETDKLECVKYLVPKVLDVQNLPYIQDVFNFKSTKDDYLKFLNRR